MSKSWVTGTKEVGYACWSSALCKENKDAFRIAFPFKGMLHNFTLLKAWPTQKKMPLPFFLSFSVFFLPHQIHLLIPKQIQIRLFAHLIPDQWYVKKSDEVLVGLLLLALYLIVGFITEFDRINFHQIWVIDRNTQNIYILTPT